MLFQEVRWILFFTIFLSHYLHAQSADPSPHAEHGLYTAPPLQEKVFVHFDRNYYLAGETMWFKIYVVDGTSNQLLDLSKVCYVEILNQDNEPVVQKKIAVNHGTGKGSAYLPLTIKSGTYKIRAYTNWMKNFGADFYFEEDLQIVNSFVKPDIPLSEKKHHYDIQFFPEGGHLVNGIESKVAYKVVDGNGKGINGRGILLNHKNDTLASFSTFKFGMGHFFLTPTESTSYRVLFLTSKDSLSKRLPVPLEEGYVIQVTDLSDSLLLVGIEINVRQGELLSLWIQGKQGASMAFEKKTINGRTEFLIDKSRLDEGISKITLFDSQDLAVCERLYFKYPASLSVNAYLRQKKYTTREKIDLRLDIGDEQDTTDVKANLSLAIFHLDSLNHETSINISNYLWLTSDLKGIIESPGYYFDHVDSSALAAMDNLMLTHGWRKFVWERKIQQGGLEFLPEHEGHVVKALVTQKNTATPATNIASYFSIPGEIGHLYGSRSNEKGELFFVTKNLVGKNNAIIQVSPENDMNYTLSVIDPFSKKFAEGINRRFSLSDKDELPLKARHRYMQIQNLYWANASNKIDSSLLNVNSFYGYPDASYKLDDYTRFPTMEEVMREYISEVIVRKKGEEFNFRIIWAPQQIHADPPLVLFNKAPVFDLKNIMAFDPLEVEKIDIIRTGYFLEGGISVRGIINYTTYNGKMEGLEIDPNALQLIYDGLEPIKEFYSPMYGEEIALTSPKPDFRNLLYWNPDILFNEENTKILSFYTSDLKGTYLGVLQGISKDGKTLYTTFSFEVRETIN